MPISGPVFSGLLMVELASQGFTGAQLLQLSNGIGNGVANYLLTSAIYQGVGIGTTVGAGVGTGFVQGIVGPVAGMNIFQMMTAVGFTGPKAIQMAMAIGNAFSSFISLGIVNSVCIGMAIGTGTGTLIVAGPAMAASIMGMLTAVGFTGSQTLQLAMAIGNGICNTILSSGIVMTVLVGGGFPPIPMTGVDIGMLS
jgi:hypothetical protein